MLNNYYYLRGGSEKVLLGEVELLQNNGHQVAIFTRNFAKNLDSKYSPFFAPDLPLNSAIRSIWRAAFTSKELIYSSTTKKYLETLLKAFRPDIAHAHNIYGRLTTSVLDVFRKHNIPVLLTLHDYKLICPSYQLLNNGNICEDCKKRRYYMAVFNKCHKDSYVASAIYALETTMNKFLGKFDKSVSFYISPSNFLKKKCIEFGMPAFRVIHVPNFIYVDDYIPNYNFKNYLIYFGRLSHEKGILTMIKAFELLNSKGVELLIVGDGPLREQLEAEAKVRGLGNIKFLGYLANDRLLSVLAKAMASILPSEWYENGPMSVMESFAMGKPVIGARIGGITEMIENGINGYLFEPGNPEDLAQKINLLLSKTKKDVVDMGMLARKNAEEKYNAESHYHKLMRLYDKVLSRKENQDEETGGKGGFKSL